MVSGRRSLYRQSTGRGGYANDLDETVVHWERAWVVPVPVATPSANGTSTKTNGQLAGTPSGGNSDEKAASTQLSFKVKVWAQLENQSDFTILKDGDDDDYINLVAATTQALKRKGGTGNQIQTGSLSAADIRGAVGGESMSISSYTSNEQKPKTEADAAEPTATATEAPVEKVEESAPAPAATEVKPTESETEAPKDTTEAAGTAADVDMADTETKDAKPDDAAATEQPSEPTQTDAPEQPAPEAAAATEDAPSETTAAPTEEPAAGSKPEEPSAAAPASENTNEGDVEMKDA